MLLKFKYGLREIDFVIQKFKVNNLKLNYKESWNKIFLIWRPLRRTIFK